MKVLKKEASLLDGIALLESKGYGYGGDIGSHSSCFLMSSCSLAIKVRKEFKERGIQIPDELEIPDKIESNPFNINNEEIRRDFKMSFLYSVEDREVVIDMTEMLRPASLRKIQEHLSRERIRFQRLSVVLQQSYLRAMRAIKDSPVQLNIPISVQQELRLFIGTNVQGGYTFTFEEEYHPVEIVDHLILYKITPEYQELLKREVYLEFLFNRAGILSRASLRNLDGSKFIHYHGDGNDCWGTVAVKHLWDGDLGKLNNLRERMVRSLILINGDSLITHGPSGLPTYEDVFRAAKKQGEEGIPGKTEKKVWGQ